MSDLEQAARQVLAALKGADRVPPRLYWVGRAIVALESALAQQAQQAEPVVDYTLLHDVAEKDGVRAALELKDKLKQQAEPVAAQALEWTPCVKLPVTVHVRQQRPGETHVSTREGITPVKPDDLIMRGVSGEEYPIGREIFERTYLLGDANSKASPVQAEPVAWMVYTADGPSFRTWHREVEE